MYFILFIFGLVVGSFLNVISLRYKEEGNVFNSQALSGRSRCPICRKNLAWYELIPIISFIIQRGECRHCGHKISLQYPIVEIISGLIFVSVPYSLSAFSQFIVPNYYLPITVLWILVFLILLLLSSIDFRLFIIPDMLNGLLAIFGAALIFLTQQSGEFGNFKGSFFGAYSFVFGLRENIWANHIVAAFLAAGFFAMIIFLTKGKAMGWGDVKLAAALGFIFGWPDITMVLGISFIIGAIFGVGLVIMGKKKIKSVIPFGPFLAMGAVATFLFGLPLIELYLKLLAV